MTVWFDKLAIAILALYAVRVILAHALTWRKLAGRKETHVSDKDLPPISIIKPVRGLDQEAEENFRRFIAADYPAAFELIFCVEERDDPAVLLIERLIAEARTIRKGPSHLQRTTGPKCKEAPRPSGESGRKTKLFSP